MDKSDEDEPHAVKRIHEQLPYSSVAKQPYSRIEEESSKYRHTPTHGSVFAEEAQTLWIILFACLAECITSCFVPEWRTQKMNINISSTLLNVIGAAIDGFCVGYEHVSHDEGVKILSRLFRTGFLGVFTSYSYMVEHAGTLSSAGVTIGPLYIGFCLISSCVAFEVSRSLITLFFTDDRHKINKSDRHLFALELSDTRDFPQLFIALFVAIMMILGRAAFGPKGFVRDPNDPQFLSNFKIDDGIELLMGMIMSGTAILLSRRIGKVNILNQVQWGTWRCNALACSLTLLAYGSSMLSIPLRHNLIMLKFVTSFCGSLSCFSGTIGDTMILYGHGLKTMALLNLSVNTCLALVFLPYFHK